MAKTGWIVFGIIVVLLIVGGIFLYKPAPTPIYNNSTNITNPILHPVKNTDIVNLSVVNANNQFALDLYKTWASNNGNMFFSPYSISSALAMTYEGAKGTTAKEMEGVLHFPLDSTIRREGFSQINAEINNPDKPYALSTANALWAQKNYPFYPDYLSNVEQFYGGKTTNLDFVGDTEGSRKIINTWVENKTNNKIKDLIPQGSLDETTRLVLTNAIYFKANWTSKFEVEGTTDEDFKTINSTIKVPTMHQTSHFNYAETSDLQALEMDYLGNDLSMIILLPKKDINSLESNLDNNKLSQIRDELKIEKVDVSLPRFNMKTKYMMKDTLSSMGMPTAFSDYNANFSGMADLVKAHENLYISAVIHQAFVNVTESGTEAAAATAVLIGATTAMPQQEEIKIFNADHPFIFIIQQKDTGNILFMGRVSNPLG